MWKPDKSIQPQACFWEPVVSFEFLTFSWAISTFSTQFRPSFMSYSPFVLMWGEEKGNVFECWFSPFVRPFMWPQRHRKGNDGEELERSLTAFFHSRGMERRDDYEGWWTFYFIYLGVLTPLQKLTKTPSSISNGEVHGLVFSVLTAAPAQYQCSLSGNLETEVFI